MTPLTEEDQEWLRKPLQQNDPKKNNYMTTQNRPVLKIGKIKTLSKKQDYGFIGFEDDQIFFHINNVNEPIDIGDKVVFEIRDSKRIKDKNEAYKIRKVHRLENGIGLYVSSHIAFLPGAKERLYGVLKSLEFSEEDLKKDDIHIELDDKQNQGYTYASKIDYSDEIFYAKRLGKNGFSRFAENKLPEPTSIFTVIIKPREAYVEVVAAYFGKSSPPEPWDRIAKAESLDYWRSHALIPHEAFKIDYSTRKDFDPDFFKSFEEIQNDYKIRQDP